MLVHVLGESDMAACRTQALTRPRPVESMGEWVGWTVASRAGNRPAPRNVRAPQGRAVGNTHPEQSARQCHREQTADVPELVEGTPVRVKGWCKRPPESR